jgi:DnaJ homolog subfamily C member 28
MSHPDEAPDKRRIAHRKDAEGKIQAGPTWESLVDRQIREAMEEGQFDNLPHQGAPLPIDENPYAGEWALAFHMLKNAGVAPPWVEAGKELNDLLQKREALFERASMKTARRDRAALEELVIQINMAVARMNAQAPSSAAHRPSLVLPDELARYDAACRRDRLEG